MTLFIKIGTMPRDYYNVKSKRKPPAIGEKIEVRPTLDVDAKWEPIRITDKQEDKGGLTWYLAERW